MIESMTGYGSARIRQGGTTINVSLRSVNNKSFKLTIRLPEQIAGAQEEVEQLIRAKINRGTIYCQVEVNGPLASAFSLDEKTMVDYYTKLKSLAAKTGAPQDIRLEEVATLPGVVREEKNSSSQLPELVMKVVKKALMALMSSRKKEGVKIEQDLRKYISKITALTGKVKTHRKKFMREYNKKLTARIDELLDSSKIKVSQKDIVREAAIVAERSDIAEELQRLGMHIQQINKILSGSGPAGRQLEFVSQEMLREANTMSAKSVSSEIVVPLLDLKSNVDRIREQVQNVQ